MVTGPAETPISLSEAKAHLVVEHTDDDALITSLINQATDYVETQTGRFLITQTWDYLRDRTPCGALEIPARNVTAVANLTQNGETILPQSTIELFYLLDFRSTNFRIEPITSWPTLPTIGFNHWSLHITQGYGAAADVPNDLKTAIYLMVGHLYRNREATVVGTIAGNLPMGVEDFMRPYRVLPF